MQASPAALVELEAPVIGAKVTAFFGFEVAEILVGIDGDSRGYPRIRARDVEDTERGYTERGMMRPTFAGAADDSWP